MCRSIVEGGRRCSCDPQMRHTADVARRVFGVNDPQTRQLVVRHQQPGGALDKARTARGRLAAQTMDQEEMDILMRDTSYQVRWALALNPAFRRRKALVAKLKLVEKRQEVLDALAGSEVRPRVALRPPVFDVSSYEGFVAVHGPSDEWTPATLDALVEAAKESPQILDDFTVSDHIVAMGRYSDRRIAGLVREHGKTHPELLAAAWVSTSDDAVRRLVLERADALGLAALVMSEDRLAVALATQRLGVMGRVKTQMNMRSFDAPKSLQAISEARAFALSLDELVEVAA